jgi:hypothetical protein
MTPCNVCGQDIFPRVTTRLMGDRCLEHAIAHTTVHPVCDVQYAAGMMERWCDRRRGHDGPHSGNTDTAGR